MDRVYQIVDNAGVTLEEIIDSKAVLTTLEFALSPIISDFLPTAINILLFGGKRSVEFEPKVNYPI